MTIIIILATITMMQYVGINKKARDSARRADIYELSAALEVNKDTESYKPLQTGQFSSFQWKDPKGSAYCIGVGNPSDPGDIPNWGSTCPSGFNPVSPGEPEGIFYAWKVCTFLEIPASGQSNVFCRSSSQ